jgi:hypothetical protein
MITFKIDFIKQKNINLNAEINLFFNLNRNLKKVFFNFEKMGLTLTLKG